MGRGPAAFGLRAPGTRRLAVLAYHAIEEPRLFAQHLDYVQRHMQRSLSEMSYEAEPDPTSRRERC